MTTATAPLPDPTRARPDRPPAATGGSRWTPVRLARLAGVLYLVVLVTGAPPELLVRSRLMVAGDATATADNIRESVTLVRLAAVSDLVNIVAFLGVALVLYGLLRRLHGGAARAMLAFNAVSVGIMALNTVHHLGAMLAATRPELVEALGAESADGMAMLFLQLHSLGFSVAEIFFGLWLFPLGWMLWHWRAAPRVIAGLLMVGSVGYLANVVATLTAPGLETALTPILTTPPALAETALLLWLMARGLRLPDRAAA